MADLTQLQTLREHYVATLAVLDAVIAEEQARLSLHEDQVAQRKLENAFKLGRTLGNSVAFATPDARGELVEYLAAHFGGQRHLMDEALQGADRSWADAGPHARPAAGS